MQNSQSVNFLTEKPELDFNLVSRYLGSFLVFPPEKYPPSKEVTMSCVIAFWKNNMNEQSSFHNGVALITITTLIIFKKTMNVKVLSM